MKCEYKLSNVTKEYLDRFYRILDEMIEGMEKAKLTESISNNFIVQMIPHHRAAIEMSENLLKYTTLVPLQNIAEDIITEQTKSIENMREIQSRCSELENPCRDVNLYRRGTEMIMKTMFSEMKNACADNSVNGNFIREMIPHHEGAIRMSYIALKYDICPELKPILYAIIKSQEKGVMQMRCLLHYICR